MSREKHRDDTLRIHEPGGGCTVLRLKYKGKRSERFGMMHVYEVISVGETSKPKGARANGR